MEHQHPPLSNEVGPQKRSSSCPSSLLGNHYHLFSSNPHLTSGPRELECLPFPKRPSTAFQVLLPNPPRTPAPKAAVPSTATPFFMKVIYLSNHCLLSHTHQSICHPCQPALSCFKELLPSDLSWRGHSYAQTIWEALLELGTCPPSTVPPRPLLLHACISSETYTFTPALIHSDTHTQIQRFRYHSFIHPSMHALVDKPGVVPCSGVSDSCHALAFSPPHYSPDY